MKYKVLKGTDLFKKLDALRQRMTDCNNAAFDLVKEIGYKKMRGKNMVLAGGISTIEIPGGQPNGWRKNHWGLKDEYYPKKNKANKELLARIEALPVVEYEELNEILKFDSHDSDSNKMSFHPGVYFEKKEILIDISRHYRRYKPVKGMIEILESEFLRKTTEKKKQ